VILADSNILIYAINKRSPKNTAAQSFLQKNAGQIVVAHQNILETVRVLTHKKFSHPVSIDSAFQGVDQILAAAEVISPNEETFDLMRELIKDQKLSSDQIFDAYLVATSLSNEVRIIATDNVRDFKVFPQIKVINPFS
jgi:predicted nucleic acid-binding protein